MEPNPVALLTPVFGADAAAIVSFLAFIGYVITWVAPMLPPPTENANPGWKFVYQVANKIAANIGYAKNEKKTP